MTSMATSSAIEQPRLLNLMEKKTNTIYQGQGSVERIQYPSEDSYFWGQPASNDDTYDNIDDGAFKNPFKYPSKEQGSPILDKSTKDNAQQEESLTQEAIIVDPKKDQQEQAATKDLKATSNPVSDKINIPKDDRNKQVKNNAGATPLPTKLQGFQDEDNADSEEEDNEEEEEEEKADDLEDNEDNEDSEDNEDNDEDDIFVAISIVDHGLSQAAVPTVPTNIASHVIATSYFNGYGVAAGHAEDESAGLGLIGMFEKNEASFGNSLERNYGLHLLTLVFLLWFFSRNRI